MMRASHRWKASSASTGDHRHHPNSTSTPATCDEADHSDQVAGLVETLRSRIPAAEVSGVNGLEVGDAEVVADEQASASGRSACMGQCWVGIEGSAPVCSRQGLNLRPSLYKSAALTN